MDVNIELLALVLALRATDISVLLYKLLHLQN